MELVQVFRVGHPIDPVWEALTDLTLVADCLPGATVTSIVNGVHHGSMTVRLGSIRATFSGTAELTDVDVLRRRVTLSARGGGEQGQIQVLVKGAAVALDESTTEIQLSSMVQLSGRIAQLGHGAATAVIERLIEQLTANLDRHLSGLAPAAQDALPALSFGPVLVKAALGRREFRIALTALAGFATGACYVRVCRRR